MELAVELAAGEGALDLRSIVEEHKQMVYRIAYSMLRNHHDAEDAAQETFLRVWRAQGKLARVDDARAWIARIAWNAAADRRRSRRSADAEPLDELAAAVAQAGNRGASAEEMARGAELQRLLAALIAALPPKLREVIELSTVEELDHAEIGRVLGLPPDKVRFRLFQARQLLREKLERLL